ncbi:BspA family leucine-rich repeat surface protein, partial [Lactococcus garvieae]|uniref:BspA family leucine-rich repeat surface protein n=1 Tax=Lactococcus garvieae TaxID=1363 RepID=UPI00254AFCEA
MIQSTWGTAPVIFDETTGVLTIDAGTLGSTPTVYGDQPPGPDSTIDSQGIIARKDVKQIVFHSGVIAPEDSSTLFANMGHLTTVTGNLDTSHVTNMFEMFLYDFSLTSLDVSHFDTSHVTNMSAMFSGTRSLTSLDVSHFDTSQVTNMDGMFASASSLTSLDVSHFDTSHVTNMTEMFVGASSLTSLDLSGWDTSQVTDMYVMFGSASSLTSLDLSGWDTSQVTNMEGMFNETTSLKKLVLGSGVKSIKGTGLPNVSATSDYTGKWINVGSGTETAPKGSHVWSSADFMNNYTSADADTYVWQSSQDFWGTCPVSFDRTTGVLTVDAGTLGITSSNPTIDSQGIIARKDVKQIVFHSGVIAPEDSSLLLGNMENLTTVTGNLDTSHVTNMSGMFNGASSLTSLDLSGWDTSQVTTMYGMFSGASSLTSLDVSHFDTSHVTNMSGMFYGASSLTSLDVSHWDTSQVTTMSGMFYGASSLTSLDVSHWDTSQVTTMSGMFLNDSSLTSLDVSHFDTSHVTNMYTMFYGASSLTSLDVSHFDTSHVTTMYGMFSGASSLTSLDVSHWDTSQVTDMTGLFSGTTSLKKLVLGSGVKSIKGTDLPNVSATSDYTGKWINVGSGTETAPKGSHVWSSADFMNNYTSADADTYVWQPSDFWGTCPISFDRTTGVLTIDAGTLGSTPTDFGLEPPGPDHTIDSQRTIARKDVKQIVFHSGVIAPEDSSSLFANMTNLTTVTGNLDTSQVTNMYVMFINDSSLTSLDVSHWDTSQVTSIRGMFSGASSLTSLDVSHWNTSHVTDMTGLFNSTKALTSIDVSNWDTSKVTSMRDMFLNNSSLTSLDVSHWDTSHVTDMSRMFDGTTSLKKLVLGSGVKSIKGTNLPNISATSDYTGKWINVGSGTETAPKGSHVWSSADFMNNYTSADADTY